MAPIRIGFIGLSKTGWARAAHLPYLLSTSRFKIVAICNSSVESAREAVESYGLPAETRAYGNPEDLAQDPNVDLVVCSVRVDKHFAAIAPTLKAGKSVYVEWPLGKNLEEAEELLRLSKAHDVKQTVVGLQGRFAPSVKKLKELLAQGRIGKVLSSTWVGYAGNGGPTESEGMKYLADADIGGNLMTIHFGHTVDFIQQVLGTFKAASGIIANRRPLIQLLNNDGSAAVKDFPKTTNDTIMVHGLADNDAPVSYNLRGGKAFKDTPGQDWRIYGEKGEIHISASGPFLNIGYPDITIAIHNFANNEVEEIDIGKDSFEEFGFSARNVARVYEAIADRDKSILCDFEDAVERHRLIDTLAFH